MRLIDGTVLVEALAETKRLYLAKDIDGVALGIETAIAISENAPTIDAVSVEWIPCEERLPSERGEYLVTVTYEGDTYVECLHYGKPTMANREVKGECFYDSDDEWGDVVYDTEAIAWMPLPEPWKGADDE